LKKNALDKREHISYWLEQAADDWEAVDALYRNKKYMQALFFAHLVIEKLCKAGWVRDNESNIPPKTHNLVYLLSQTKMDVPDELNELMLLINRFQLEGRYPDYVNKMYQICNKDFTTDLLERINKLKQWLLKSLQ
jgi:HEPN domain-containing protein